MPKRTTPTGRRKSSAKKTSRPTRVSRKRSLRPRFATPAAEAALVAFASFAARKRLRWYLFGGQAANYHGSPRNTADLDITIDLGDAATPAFIASLAKAGFDAAAFADTAFIATTRVIPVIHRATHYPIDLVLAGPGFEQRFLDEAVDVALGRTKVPVISAENLVALKVLAGRPKDLEDVRALLASRSLAHDTIEETLRQFEGAIGDSELVDAYRRLRGEK
jgi:Nucleotidyl transferase AbiEii toxin, Type IV TA system